jgi:hypothetical protein
MTVATRHDAPIPNFGFSFEAVLCVSHAALNEIRWSQAEPIKNISTADYSKRMHRQLPLGTEGFQIKLLKVKKSPVADRIKNLSKAEKKTCFIHVRERDCKVRLVIVAGKWLKHLISIFE